MSSVPKQAPPSRPDPAVDYQAIVEALQEGIWIIDEESNTVFVNEPMAKMLGYTPAEMVGKHLFDFMDERGVEISKRNLARRAEGIAEQHDFELLHRDGSCVYTAMETAPITDEEGRYRGAVAGVLDMSERRRAEDALRSSEARFRAVFEDASVAIVLASPHGRIEQVNPAMERMLAYSAEELVGRGAAEITHPDDLAATARLFQRMLAGGDGEQMEKRYLRKDGEIVRAVTSVAVVRDDEDKPKALMAMLQDVTELRLAQNELVRVQRLESLGVLAGGIAHDYNNILTAILANVALAKEDAPPGSEQEQLLRAAEDATHQAVKLARQLLTFARGGAPVLAPVDLRRFLRETVRFSLSGSALRCELDVEDDLRWINADSGQIGQVISNLVTNAVQAQPRGGAIEIAARNVDVEEEMGSSLPPGQYVEVDFTDHGCGIEPDAVGHVFDPYFTTKPEGSGLGLAVTHRIVQNHDGTVRVRSVPGKGTTFTVTLPALDGEAPGDGPSGATGPELAARVLVMDDEPAIRRVLFKALTRRGCRVVEAADGAAAIECYVRARADDDPFDVVILDLTVPGGMGGRETMARLLELDPEVRAIVSSGYSGDAAMAEHRELGFADVLAKPYRPRDMVAVVERVLREAES
jgi:PAS domain S-box-containing protein